MDQGLLYILCGFSFWLGACVASFLNVVIWRVPRGESIVSPPSHCPKCNAEIKWYQNIPILAWICLRGKCANCKAPISPRYILIETLGGLLLLAAFAHLFVQKGIDLADPTGWIFLAVYWIWISLMITGAFIDFDLQLLPDFVTVGGMILGILFNVCLSVVGKLWFPVCWSLSGLVFGFGLLWFVRWLGSKAFKREALGLGDVFLMGAVGALFGPVAVLVTLILSSLFGSLVGVGLIVLSKAKLGKFVAIPYGPYICMGCLVWMFWGPELVRWYLQLLFATPMAK